MTRALGISAGVSAMSRAGAICVFAICETWPMTEITLEKLADELKALRLAHFDYDVAWALGSKLRASAEQQELAVAIQIRHGEDVVFSTLLRGATSDNFDWTRRKCAVAHRFQCSSLAVRLKAEARGYDFNSVFRLAPADFAASGGGFPMLLPSGLLVGTIGVSGLPDVEDHSLITSTLEAFLKHQDL